ncbi:Hypothetical protein CINCED_3A003498 [Cinara cedri]|uniref:Uncharacterized protein n=1 Tax=Cinara cedri TaxID=506608 RepID=A0A5E4NPD2_9HEMI|nr:Hypothetical protein CINCED_3A003498 [Cinara cedri]
MPIDRCVGVGVLSLYILFTPSYIIVVVPIKHRKIIDIAAPAFIFWLWTFKITTNKMNYFTVKHNTKSYIIDIEKAVNPSSKTEKDVEEFELLTKWLLNNKSIRSTITLVTFTGSEGPLSTFGTGIIIRSLILYSGI